MRAFSRGAAAAALLFLALLGGACASPPARVPEEAKRHNDKGVVALRKGDYDTAIKEFELALKLAPLFVQAQANLGLACHKRGFSDRGIRELKAAIEVNPNYADSYNYLGVIYTDKKLYKEAEDWFELAIDTYPAYDEAYYNLGMLYLKQNRSADALKAFIKATKIRPSFVEAHLQAGWLYFHNGVYKDALQHADLAEPLDEKREPKENGSAQALKGLIQWKWKERYDVAIKHLRRALELDKDEPNAKKYLPLVYEKAPDRLAKEIAAEAKKKYDEGKIAEAEKDLDAAGAIDPRLVDVPLIRAQILMDKRDLKGAEKEAKRALALDKGNRDARFTLGAIYMMRRDYAAAEEHFRVLRKEQPRHAKYHLYLGTCYYMQKKYRKAEREWKEAFKCDKPAPNDQQKKLIEGNLAELEKLPTFRKANELNGEGARLLARGDLSGAEDKFKQALALDPEFAFSACNLALVAIERGDLPLAERLVEQALALDEDMPQAHNNFGVIRFRQNRFKAAEAAFRKAAELDPGYAEPHFNLGVLYHAQKKDAEAEQALEAAINTDPNHARAAVALAQLYMERRPPIFGKAETWLKYALGVDAQLAVAHYMLARLLCMQGRHQEALQSYEGAYQRNPDDPAPWMGWAECQVHLGDKRLAFGAFLEAYGRFQRYGRHQDAVEAARRAVELDPESAPARMALGLALLDVGLMTEAVSELRRATELDPQDLLAQFELGNGYARMGDKRRAAEAYRAVHERNPQNPAPLLKLVSLYQEGEETGPVTRALAIEYAKKALALKLEPEQRKLVEARLQQLEGR